MSGIDLAEGRSIRKGAPDAVLRFVKEHNGQMSSWMTPPLEVRVEEIVKEVASNGATPLLVAKETSLPAWWCSRTF